MSRDSVRERNVHVASGRIGIGGSILGFRMWAMVDMETSNRICLAVIGKSNVSLRIRVLGRALLNCEHILCVWGWPRGRGPMVEAVGRDVVESTVARNTGKGMGQVNPWGDQNGTSGQWDALVTKDYKHAFLASALSNTSSGSHPDLPENHTPAS